jgi:hypothetical protein
MTSAPITSRQILISGALKIGSDRFRSLVVSVSEIGFVFGGRCHACQTFFVYCLIQAVVSTQLGPVGYEIQTLGPLPLLLARSGLYCSMCNTVCRPLWQTGIPRVCHGSLAPMRCTILNGKPLASSRCTSITHMLLSTQCGARVSRLDHRYYHDHKFSIIHSTLRHRHSLTSNQEAGMLNHLGGFSTVSS